MRLFRALLIAVFVAAAACGTEPSAPQAIRVTRVRAPAGQAPDATPTPASSLPPSITPDPLEATQMRAATARETSEVPGEDLRSVVAGLNALGLDLHRALPAAQNLLLSPTSIGVALAMTYAGARRTTAEQMRRTLHFELPDERLHAAFNALDRKLESRGAAAAGTEGRPFRLRVANAVWAQAGLRVEQPYLDTLSRHYGAGLRLQDFVRDPEASRQAINRWVAEQTQEKIRELLSRGMIDIYTRLVLTNAVYFNAAWLYPFSEQSTSDGEFTLADGSVARVPFMRQVKRHRHATGDGWQAVEMLYDGREVAMLLIVPDTGRLADVEGGLDLEQIEAGLQEKTMRLSLPRFAYRAQLTPKEALKSLGMVDLFDPDLADLTGIADLKPLYVSQLAHEATIDVNEHGTEAAAATAAVISTTSAPIVEVEVTVDRPFLLAIRDLETGAVVFWGRVLDPRG